MAKTKLVGDDRKEKLDKQKKAAKQANRKKRKSPARFFKDIWSELKKVTWPSRKDLFKYTGAVIAFIIVMIVIVGLFDWGISSGVNALFKLNP